mgnify:CR=1 FL=1
MRRRTTRLAGVSALVMLCGALAPRAAQAQRPTFDQTVAQLGNADPDARLRAVQALKESAYPEAAVPLTRALAGAYAKNNVRVNAICAGRILTERITSNYGTPDKPGPIVDRQDAAGRSKDYPFWVGKPEDIANIALFLASEESRMITGATIPAEGGRSAY